MISDSAIVANPSEGFETKGFPGIFVIAQRRSQGHQLDAPVARRAGYGDLLTYVSVRGAMRELNGAAAAIPKQNRILQLLLAFLLPVAALLLELMLSSLTEHVWFLFFYPAVFLVSWIGGLRAGLVATVLSAVFVLWFFVPPHHSFIKLPYHYFPAAVFCTMGVLFGVVHERLRNANQRARDALGASERANERLKQAVKERRVFAALIENSSDFIGIADPDGKPVYLNPGGRRMVGLPADRAVETTQISEFYPPDLRPFASDVIVKSMVERGDWEGETYLRNWQTEVAIPVSDKHFLIHEPDTGEIVGMGTVTRDISDLRRARDELREANREVTRLYEKTKSLDDLKTRFFASISHDLRTPLALILGPTEHLLAAPETTPAARRDLNVVARNARTLLGRVNDLLDVQMLDAGHMKPEYAQTDVSRLARFVAGHFEPLSKENQTALLVEAPETSFAQVDPGKVQRILMNLLSNAFKFTPAGGRIRLTLRETPERVVLEVADSGPGIPPEQRQSVFEPFRQFDSGPTRKFGGTGLALSIAREFALAHGGSIAIFEAPEGGALFVVELPRTAPAGAVIRDKAEETEPRVDLQHAADELRAHRDDVVPRVLSAEGPLVLVVEDNAEMNEVICDNLSNKYRVAAAFDGKQGLEKAKAIEPDIILSDIMMPEMNGDELVRAVRRLPELDQTPIILLTAKADDSLRVKLLGEGAQDYLTKPFAIEELRARVANLVEKKLAAELVQQAEAKFDNLVSIAAEAILMIDQEQQIVLYNEGAREIFGWSREEVIGKHLDVLFSPPFRDVLQSYLQDLAASDAKARPMGDGIPTIFGLRKNGEHFPVEAAMSKLRAGNAWLFTLVMHDITEHPRINESEPSAHTPSP